MRILEQVQRMTDELRARGSDAAPWAGEPAWQPAPGADGALVQDPDFTLPTTAGELRWSLFHRSPDAAETGPWGYGRHASFPLNLRSDGNVVTVTREDGTQRQYR